MSDERRMRGMRCGVLTASDRVSRGAGKNDSGQYLVDTLGAQGAEIVAHVVVPDDLDTIARTLADMADTLRVDLVLTTGGSGVARRDVTPEATLRVDRAAGPGDSRGGPRRDLGALAAGRALAGRRRGSGAAR